MFEAYTNTSQTLATGNSVNFDTIKWRDCRVTSSGNTVTISRAGRYFVEMNAVGGSATAASPFTLQLYANGSALPEAITTVTSTDANDPQTLHLGTIVNVGASCPIVSGAVALQVKATSTDSGAISSANLVIYKL